MQYKWEVYCGFPLFFSKLRSQESTTIQMEVIVLYKLEVYCVALDKLYGLGGVPEHWPLLRSALLSSSLKVAPKSNPRTFARVYLGMFRKAPDTFKFLRHVRRAIMSVRPKCSHGCVSLK